MTVFIGLGFFHIIPIRSDLKCYFYPRVLQTFVNHTEIQLIQLFGVVRHNKIIFPFASNYCIKVFKQSRDLLMLGFH